MLPIWNKTHKFFKPLLRRILKLKYGPIHKFLHLASIPTMWFEEFVARVKAMPKMIMMTRKALITDDWDSSYRDEFVLDAPIIEQDSNEKEKNVIDIALADKKKAIEALKAKRRSEHFFHGAIKFPK